MRDFMAAGQHNLSPDFAALIRATVTRPPTILILPRETGEDKGRTRRPLGELDEAVTRRPMKRRNTLHYETAENAALFRPTRNAFVIARPR
jgi:hypothetical protein